MNSEAQRLRRTVPLLRQWYYSLFVGRGEAWENYQDDAYEQSTGQEGRSTLQHARSQRFSLQPIKTMTTHQHIIDRGPYKGMVETLTNNPHPPKRRAATCAPNR